MIVWCEDHYCIHNSIGRCALHSIRLRIAGVGSVVCALQDDKQASTDYIHVDIDD